MKVKRTQAMRMAEHDAILRRFPKGGKDSLDKVQPLGQSFSPVGAMTYALAKAFYPKRFGVK